MKTLLPGVEPHVEPDVEPDGGKRKGDCQSVGDARREDSCWRPEPLLRTCLSSLTNSQQFGRMMAAEADSRGFCQTAKQAFVCDGLPYNGPFTEHTFQDSHPFSISLETEGWATYVKLVSMCWQGRVDSVIEILTGECKTRRVDLQGWKGRIRSTFASGLSGSLPKNSSLHRAPA